MSGFGSMVVGGLFNAVAFAGAGYIFSKFNKDGYKKKQEDTISLWRNSQEHNKNRIRKT